MNPHRIEELVRQALEAEAFELDALSTPRRSRPTVWLRVGASAAAAAAFALAWVSTDLSSTPRRLPERALVRDRSAAVPVDAPRGASNVMLALVRAWSGDCECLMWEVHHWLGAAEPERVLAREALEAGLDESEAPPEGQFVLVSLPRAGGGVVNGREAAHELLACLNTTAAEADLNEPVECSARTVAECLPEGGRILAAAMVRD